MDWKESLKAKAGNTLAKIEETARSEARTLLAELTMAGVVLTAAKESLKVSGASLNDDQRAKIKRLKGELLAILRIERVVEWHPDDLAIRCSLSSSGIVDFIIGPAVDGVGQEINEAVSQVFLDNSAPSWRLKVTECGGGKLHVYDLAQWEQAKERFAGVLGL